MLVMIKAILYEGTVALCASMDLGKVWSRWRKEAVKTAIHIQNILEKPGRKLFSVRSQRI